MPFLLNSRDICEHRLFRVPIQDAAAHTLIPIPITASLSHEHPSLTRIISLSPLPKRELLCQIREDDAQEVGSFQERRETGERCHAYGFSAETERQSARMQAEI